MRIARPAERINNDRVLPVYGCNNGSVMTTREFGPWLYYASVRGHHETVWFDDRQEAVSFLNNSEPGTW